MALPFRHFIPSPTLGSVVPIGIYEQSPITGDVKGVCLYNSYTVSSIYEMIEVYNAYFQATFQRMTRKCGIERSVFGLHESIDPLTLLPSYSCSNGHQNRYYDHKWANFRNGQNIIDSIPPVSFPLFFDGPNGLLDFVTNALSGVGYLGILAYYDTAIRIGQDLQNVIPSLATPVEPVDYVYLPSSNGPYAGAQNLWSRFAGVAAPIIPSPNRILYSNFTALDPYFGILKPIEIEDMLCVFHNNI